MADPHPISRTVERLVREISDIKATLAVVDPGNALAFSLRQDLAAKRRELSAALVQVEAAAEALRTALEVPVG